MSDAGAGGWQAACECRHAATSRTGRIPGPIARRTRSGMRFNPDIHNNLRRRDGPLFRCSRPFFDSIDPRDRSLSPFISKMEPWWRRRSSKPAVIRSPWNIRPHSLNGGLLVTGRLPRSQRSANTRNGSSTPPRLIVT